MRCNLLIVANSSSSGGAGGMASVKPADARARHVCKKTPDGSTNCARDVRDVANCAALRGGGCPDRGPVSVARRQRELGARLVAQAAVRQRHLAFGEDARR